MTENEIQQFVNDVNSRLAEKRLGDTFGLLRNMARSLSAWEITERIASAEQAYSYMLSYLVSGTADPSREKLYASLLLEARTIRDLLVRAIRRPETPTLYYGALRSVMSHRDESFGSLFAEYRKVRNAMSAFTMASTGSAPSGSDMLRMEMIERDIFNRLWVTFPLNTDDARQIAEFILDNDLPAAVRALAVSAVTLGLLECFDERRFDLLCRAYEGDATDVSVRALVGIALALEKYKDIPVTPNMANAIAALREMPQWHDDIRQTFVELIRTNDTERISGKLKTEIFPDIQKMGRDIAERMRDGSAVADVSSDDANPEWESLISDEKIRNNLKELSELQEEGADVFMATFAGLKQFPFFNDVMNWFLPFSAERSAVTSLGLGDLVDTVTTLIGSMPYVCDSDKYSMLLSLSMMPSAQRSAMMSQLNSHRRDIEEAIAMNDRSLHPVARKSAINNYVLSIYRFYKLFRRKGEFYNPFARVANPVGITLLAPDFDSEEALISLGEFYFKVGLYDYARMIFCRLDDISMPECPRYQKIGFCNEKLGDLDAAASYYEQADLLDENNIWNLRRLLSVLRRLGRYSEALSAGVRLERLLPDDAGVALTLGSLYISAGDCDKAVNILHKAEFIDETSHKPWRPLAWALFLAGKFDEAQSYYDRILSDSPTPTDYLNMGHLAWARGSVDKALAYYGMSASDGSVNELVRMIRNDEPHLRKAGVDTSLMPLIIDAIIYNLKQQ